MITIKDVKAKTMTQEKEKSAKNDWFAYYVGRPISYFFTIPFLYTNIKPNTITLISMIFVVIGTVLTCLNVWVWLPLLGWVGFFLWNIFDGIDGNVARYKQEFSKNGSVWDATAGYLAMYFSFFSYGIASYNFPGFLTEFANIPPVVFVILGSISGFSLIFPRLVLHKKKSTLKDDSTNDLQNKSNYGWLKIIVLNLTSISGFVQIFMLIICVLAGFGIFVFDIFTSLYFFINFFMMVVSLFKLLKD